MDELADRWLKYLFKMALAQIHNYGADDLKMACLCCENRARSLGILEETKELLKNKFNSQYSHLNNDVVDIVRCNIQQIN